jgi:Tfp pilus assembly protein PilF
MVVALAMFLFSWAYAPALQAGFVLDDFANIVESPALRWNEVSAENFERLLDFSLLSQRPVANFSFAVDHLAWGLEPRGFHLTNLLIHVAVGGALAWVCLLYGRVATNAPATQTSRPPTAYPVLIGVAVFLVHPLNIQAVTYVVQRMTSLAALFTLLAFGSYLKARYGTSVRSRWWYAGAALFWLLGLGSKENALLLLPVIALFEAAFFRDFWKHKAEILFRGRWTRQWTIRAWIIAVLTAALGSWFAFATSDILTLSETLPDRDFTGLERVLTQTRVQIFYVSLLLWPAPGRLNIEHDIVLSTGLLDPPTTIIAVLVTVAFLFASIWMTVRRPRYGFPLLAYMAFHVIEAGPINLELVFEHRMYLPATMLVVLATALAVDTLPRRPPWQLLAVLPVLLVLAFWTHARNQVWADPVQLRADSVSKSPESMRAHYNLALELLEAGHQEEALVVVERAVELQPEQYLPHTLHGRILLELNRPGDALLAYETALRLDPVIVQSTLGYGRSLQALGRNEEAFRHFLAAGTRFAQGGFAWEAIPVLREAVGLRPEDALARHALGSTYLIVKSHDQAADQFRAALDLVPEKVESWYNLALAADALGLHDEALRAYREFIERAPANLQSQIVGAQMRIAELEVESIP